MEAQIQELEVWIKSNPDSRELKRALAVKMALQKLPLKFISETLGVSPGFVSKWKSQYLARGIEGVKLAYQGAQSYLKPPQRQEVIAWLQEQEFWDISELECHLIEQYDVVFKSPTSYYQLLKEAKISWQKAQVKNPKQDPGFVKKKNQENREKIEIVLEEIKAGKTVVYAIDETHLVEGDLVSHLWGDQEKRLKLPLNNPKNRQTYYGALDLFNQELVVEEYPRGNGEYTVDFLKKLQKRKPAQKIMIFWDGASYHRGEKIREFFGEVNQGLEEKDWQITCHLMPFHSPEENPIEAVWNSLKSLLRRGYRFCKNFEIMKKLFRLLVKFKLFNFPNLRNYDAFSCLI
jgi:transposase